ncbi:MAG: SDR family oxidoreductase [Chitinophagales bacterium]
MKPRLLLTGASGFLGHHLIKAAQRYEVLKLYHHHLPENDSGNWYACNLTNLTQTGDLIEDLAPDAIIHLAAAADAGFCEREPQLSGEINVEATANLAGIASDFQIPLVFTSTDLVFDGHQGNYVETDVPAPLMEYGRQKLRAENEVLQIYPNALVARIPLLFGEINASPRSPFSTMINDLKQGKNVTLFYDEYRSMCSAATVARALLDLMGEANGLLHICAAEKMSRYDFGMLTAQLFGLSTENIIKASQRDFTFSAPRPKDVSMNCNRALQLGAQIPSIANQLLQLAARQE